MLRLNLSDTHQSYPGNIIQSYFKIFLNKLGSIWVAKNLRKISMHVFDVGLLNILCLSLLHDNWPDGYIYLFIQSNLYWEVIFGTKKKWSYMTGDLLKEVHFIYRIFSERTRKRWPFNTGDCLIEVIAWAGLTVFWITLWLLSISACYIEYTTI
jgi:hypothetical protein